MSGRQSQAVAYAVRLVLHDKLTRREAADRAGVHYTSLQRALWKQGVKLGRGNPNHNKAADSNNQSSKNQDHL